MFRIAFRNLLRNRLRTSVTLVTVILGAALICFLRFIGYGMHQHMVWNIAGISTGYIRIAANGWLENRDLERALDVNPRLVEKLQRTPGVTRITPRIEGMALVGHRSHSRFVSVTALRPERERMIITLPRTVIRGNFLQDEKTPIPGFPGTGIVKSGIRPSATPRTEIPAPGFGPDHRLQSAAKASSGGIPRYQALIGDRLASYLKADLNSELSLVGAQFDGSTGAILLRVMGIFRTRDAMLDGHQIFLRLQGGRALFAPDSPEENTIRYTSLLLEIPNQREALRVTDRLRRQFPLPPVEAGLSREDSDDYSPVVHDWRELNPALVQMTELDQAGNEIWIALLVVIMSFSVLNNVQSAINERRREYGMLMAIGCSPLRLVITTLYETLLILLPGMLIGCLLGIGGSLYLQSNPIPLTGEQAEAMMDWGFTPVITAVADPGELRIALVSLFLPSFLFSLIAARRIFRLNPVEVINTM